MTTRKPIQVREELHRRLADEAKREKRQIGQQLELILEEYFKAKVKK